jgi:predicted lipoprotein with Yx(FWY)xxD motif
MKLIPAIALTLFVTACDDAYAKTSYGYGNDNTTIVAAGHAALTGKNGHTLYTFDKDSKNNSNCYDSCADSWPAYAAAKGAKSLGKGFSTIKRRDGSLQWTKDGAPLYFWIGDTAAGDTNGDGIGGVWHIVH